MLGLGLDPASVSLFFLSNNICQGNKACRILAINESTKALWKALDLGKLKTSEGQTSKATLIPSQRLGEEVALLGRLADSSDRLCSVLSSTLATPGKKLGSTCTIQSLPVQ